MKEVKVDFAKAIVGLPYAFLGIYIYETGLDFISGVLGFVLILIILPLCFIDLKK